MSVYHNNATPISQWRDLVLEGQEKAGFQLTEVIENYVVITLNSFTTQIDLATSILAIDFLKNIRVENLQHAYALRNVGDRCLILAGLFPDRAKRKRVTVDYFIHLGQHAYYILSYAARPYKIDHALFYQLFENFSDLIRVLAAMRQKPMIYFDRL